MRFYIVDCFAEAGYQGNQLLVVLADCPVSDVEQQRIAREINFSETAFVLSGRKPDGGYDVRIWTPNVGEVPFAGHPSLGAAYVIHRFVEGGVRSEVRLNLAVGQIPVRVTPDGLIMRQNAPEFGPTIDRREVTAVFGLAESQVPDALPVQRISTGLPAVIVPLESGEALSQVAVDRAAFGAYIAHHPERNCNHYFFANGGVGTLIARCMMEDFVEDPATGSAAGCLAAYLLEHGRPDSGGIAFTVRQGEDMGRPSILRAGASRDNGEWVIEVAGGCYVVASGEWG